MSVTQKILIINKAYEELFLLDTNMSDIVSELSQSETTYNSPQQDR